MLKMDDRSTEIESSSNLSEEQNDITDIPSGSRSREGKSRRNLIGFWLLGLCNNFGYVVMLSAAHDILHEEKNSDQGNQTSNNASLTLDISGSFNSTDGLECNPLSTGTVLLADILPTLIIKITAPFYMQRIPYSIRMAICVLFAFASFFIVAFSQALWFSLLGVVFASISSGFGEITLLSYSAHFDKDVVSTWSSGTGGAGVFGALSYAGFTSAGVTPRNTVLIMNVIPFTLGVSYWFILEHPKGVTEREPLLETERTEGAEKLPVDPLTIKVKLIITKSLLKFMLPLFFVYFAEYFINQGLHELIYWNRIWLTPSEQYRWYQVDYQIGVFISRSSVNIFPIKKIWILAVLQNVNLVILLCEAYFHFLPSVWIMFLIVLYEGLLGGACYVNAFYRISQEVPPKHREFSMGVTSMADSCGIALAGATALPTHNALCTYWRNKIRS
ncbi:battenin-like [Stylophora pistillata]|uniref:Battenin n=1 Tax=Stylophora pistillata TaxID=50429 RepID=A0A2B4SX90_STYPI|nr:battenin-like [Stylophora pistillata]PFX33025.1 Battenin [Stylophora pistillata]